MKSVSTRVLWLLCSTLWLGLPLAMSACADTASSQHLESLDAFPKTTLSIETSDAHRHGFVIWVADTDPRREQGLMFVRQLPMDQGMLFVFDRPSRVSMWMKNTVIPLDMLFIDSNGRVDSIIADATPMSLKILQSKSAVLGVLELAGGTTAALNITAGAIVKHPAFASVGGRR
jgi:uncharacterized protein